MDKDTDSLVISSELTIILVSVMLGVGVLSLANDVIKTAKQDGWISCIIRLLLINWINSSLRSE